MKYDNRNLLIEMNLIKASNDPNAATGDLYKLIFDYDEAGNRVRKREYYYQGQQQINPGTGDNNGGTTGTNGDNLGGDWNLVGDEYYSRDISGKEIAVYHSSNLDHWNVWGTDNAGKIDANDHKFFYLKDHLGSIRVVLDEENKITSAQDFDPWGYPLEGRSYVQDVNNGGTTDYKFTGKQRDTETGWDYFGARYYDARIGNWGSVDPLFEKHIQWTPYNYVLRNPMVLIDPDGKQTNSAYGLYLATQQILSNPEPNNQILKSYMSGEVLQERFEKFPTETGRVEQTGDEMVVAGPIVSAMSEIKLGTKIVEKEVEVLGGKLGSFLEKHGVDLGKEGTKRFVERGIASEELILKTLEKGTAFTGHKSGALTFILKGAYENGHSLLVGFNPAKSKVTTLIKGSYKSVKKPYLKELNRKLIDFHINF